MPSPNIVGELKHTNNREFWKHWTKTLKIRFQDEAEGWWVFCLMKHGHRKYYTNTDILTPMIICEDATEVLLGIKALSISHHICVEEASWVVYTFIYDVVALYIWPSSLLLNGGHGARHEPQWNGMTLFWTTAVENLWRNAHHGGKGVHMVYFWPSAIFSYHWLSMIDTRLLCSKFHLIDHERCRNHIKQYQAQQSLISYCIKFTKAVIMSGL